MTPTLALEQLMLHPLYGELVDAVRAATPAHILDQGDAAAAHATNLMTAVAILGDADASGLNPASPGWLRLGLLDTYARWVTGQAATCRHNPHPSHPTPVLAAAWKPSLIVCPDCSMLTGTSRTADTICDACGHQCGTLAQGGGIYVGMVQLGPLIYQYGTCDDCRPTPPNAPHTPEPATPRGTGRVRPTRPHNRPRRRR